LDRDGVLIEDLGLVTQLEQVRLFEDVPSALRLLKGHGFLLVVVTNQTVISRGLLDEAGVASMNEEIRRRIVIRGGPTIDSFYVCPHHPNASLSRYRMCCDCRKPEAGMLFRAAREWGIMLEKSFLVGDRMSDIVAGSRAGCTTILLQTGAHLAPPIETKRPVDLSIRPDYSCRTLTEAAQWILERS